MSANDGFNYLVRELCLIKEASSRDQPMLGICLGAQLIAKAAGASIYPNPGQGNWLGAGPLDGVGS
jgi:GMP synthase-like glutamine amidotransferase